VLLAHTLGPSGPDLELLLVALAVFVVAVILLLRSAKPIITVGVLVGALALGAGSFALGGSPRGSSPSGAGLGVTIGSPEEGDVVTAGSPIRLRVELDGGRLTTETSSSDPNSGHLHVFVDRKLVSMPSTDSPTVKLKPGEHVIAVEFVDARHLSYSPQVIDEVRVRAKIDV
jgi:hypothetical protein